jgi:hypothetical protein
MKSRRMKHNIFCEVLEPLGSLLEVERLHATTHASSVLPKLPNQLTKDALNTGSMDCQNLCLFASITAKHR